MIFMEFIINCTVLMDSFLLFLQEIRHLCLHLVGLKKASAEEMRKNVYANYASFIR